jgi:hypothetical protein
MESGHMHIRPPLSREHEALRAFLCERPGCCAPPGAREFFARLGFSASADAMEKPRQIR